jgi:hypothetical protein
MIVFLQKLRGTSPAFWILISPFFTSHCRAATRQAVGAMTALPAQVATSSVTRESGHVIPGRVVHFSLPFLVHYRIAVDNRMRITVSVLKK